MRAVPPQGREFGRALLWHGSMRLPRSPFRVAGAPPPSDEEFGSTPAATPRRPTLEGVSKLVDSDAHAYARRVENTPNGHHHDNRSDGKVSSTHPFHEKPPLLKALESLWSALTLCALVFVAWVGGLAAVNVLAPEVTLASDPSACALATALGYVCFELLVKFSHTQAYVTTRPKLELGAGLMLLHSAAIWFAVARFSTAPRRGSCARDHRWEEAGEQAGKQSRAQPCHASRSRSLLTLPRKARRVGAVATESRLQSQRACAA